MKIRLSAFVVALILAAQAVVPVFGGAVTIASDGKTDYTIVAPEKPSADEKAARNTGNDHSRLLNS